MSDRMKKIFSFGLPFVSCVVAVFFLLPSCGDNEEIVQRKSEKSYSVDEGKNLYYGEYRSQRGGGIA